MAKKAVFQILEVFFFFEKNLKILYFFPGKVYTSLTHSFSEGEKKTPTSLTHSIFAKKCSKINFSEEIKNYDTFVTPVEKTKSTRDQPKLVRFFSRKHLTVLTHVLVPSNTSTY